MNRAQLFLNHSSVICFAFKQRDNDNDLSISFHLISSWPHFQSHRWLRLLFQIYNRDFNARHQFHCQLEFCLSMEFSKLNILWAAVSLEGVHRAGVNIFQGWIFSKLNILWAAVALGGVHRPGDQNAKAAYFTLPTLTNLFQAYLTNPIASDCILKEHFLCTFAFQEKYCMPASATSQSNLLRRSFPMDCFHTFGHRCLAWCSQNGQPRNSQKL